MLKDIYYKRISNVKKRYQKQRKKTERQRQNSQKYLKIIPVVFIILFGVAPVAANIFGVLLGGSPPPAVVVPTVVTARLPGGGFFTGTTTLLQRGKNQCKIRKNAFLLSYSYTGGRNKFVIIT